MTPLRLSDASTAIASFFTVSDMTSRSDGISMILPIGMMRSCAWPVDVGENSAGTAAVACDDGRGTFAPPLRGSGDSEGIPSAVALPMLADDVVLQARCNAARLGRRSPDAAAAAAAARWVGDTKLMARRRFGPLGGTPDSPSACSTSDSRR